MKEYQIGKNAGESGYYVYSVFSSGNLFCIGWALTLWGARRVVKSAIKLDREINTVPERTFVERHYTGEK